MLIAISSNYVSAGYIILIDILLPAVVAYCVRLFLSSWNIKAIYNDRKPLQLQYGARISLVHQELSERKAGLTAAILSTVIVVLAVVGGFAIEGISRESTVPLKAPVVIEAGTGDDVIDFTKHVSEDGRLVSKTFLLARESISCFSARGKNFTVFAAKSDDRDELDLLGWPITGLGEGQTCLVEEENFKESRSILFTVDYYEHFPDCGLQVWKTEPGRLVRAFATTTRDCPFETLEFWCASYLENCCVGAVRTDAGYTDLTLGYAKDETDPSGIRPLYYHINFLHTQNRVSGASIRSMAYLRSTGTFGILDTSPAVLSMMRISIDADIERIRDTEEVTTINLRFLASTLGTAMILLSLASIITFVTWRTIVYKTGHLKQNCFYSARDVLMSAVREASQFHSYEGEKDSSRVRFGVSQKFPHVGPLTESDDEGSGFFPETELEGTDCSRPGL